MSKLSDFLEKNKIDPRRVVAASKNIERLRDEDREVRLAQGKVKQGGDVPDAVKEIAAKGRRSGRPVTPPTLKKALEGKDISNKAKTRVTRAVNEVLKTKKKDEVSAQDLF